MTSKTSSDGRYRVEIQVQGAGSGRIERGTFRFFREQNLIDTYSWETSDEYEPSFRESMPFIEWVDRGVLRMGDDKSNQPFEDEITISNKTPETVKKTRISYGRYQSFWVFDLEPHNQMVIRASPRFKADNSPNYYLGYGGETQSGKKFEGTVEGRQRRSPADGPLQFSIAIQQTDLR